MRQPKCRHSEDAVEMLCADHPQSTQALQKTHEIGAIVKGGVAARKMMLNEGAARSSGAKRGTTPQTRPHRRQSAVVADCLLVLEAYLARVRKMTRSDTAQPHPGPRRNTQVAAALPGATSSHLKQAQPHPTNMQTSNKCGRKAQPRAS